MKQLLCFAPRRECSASEGERTWHDNERCIVGAPYSKEGDGPDLSPKGRSGHSSATKAMHSSLPKTQPPTLGWTLRLRPMRMVELTGFEPVTPCLQSRCSPS